MCLFNVSLETLPDFHFEKINGIVLENKNGMRENGEYISYHDVNCDLYDEITTYMIFDGKNIFWRYDRKIKHDDVFIDVFRNGTLITYENGVEYYIPMEN